MQLLIVGGLVGSLTICLSVNRCAGAGGGGRHPDQNCGNTNGGTNLTTITRADCAAVSCSVSWTVDCTNRHTESAAHGTDGGAVVIIDASIRDGVLRAELRFGSWFASVLSIRSPPSLTSSLTAAQLFWRVGHPSVKPELVQLLARRNL